MRFSILNMYSVDVCGMNKWMGSKSQLWHGGEHHSLEGFSCHGLTSINFVLGRLHDNLDSKTKTKTSH